MPQLSAIVITRDEAANIGACLDSLAFCAERIVVDSGSTDATVEIAGKKARASNFTSGAATGRKRTTRFRSRPATGCCRSTPTSAFRPSLPLRSKPRSPMQAPTAGNFPRLSSFCGRQMRHSGWYPDYVLRLFRRGRAGFEDAVVHESVICAGPVKRLAQPLIHHPVHRLEDALSRMDRYSTASAQALAASGRRVSFLTGIGHGLFSFLRTYVLRAGFLDGAEGFLLAVANAEGSYYRHMKLWLATRGAAASAPPTRPATVTPCAGSGIRIRCQ